MIPFSRRSVLTLTLTAALTLFAGPQSVLAENLAERKEIDANADAALAMLFENNKQARPLSEKANAILIFPKITEAGIVGIGGMRGKGVLREDGESKFYYRTTSLTLGVNVGFETHGYVVMFMTPQAADKFASADTFKFGGAGEVTIIKDGVSDEIDSLTLKNDAAAFIFDEKGVRLDLTLDGTKINKMDI